MVLKTCIWCRRDDAETTFNSRAHIVPQSLGGQRLCPSVCDECNSYFGSQQQQRPAVETTLKEAFGISRSNYLQGLPTRTKQKKRKRFSSLYFNVNFERRALSLKPAFRIVPSFQSNLARQLRRGLYKMVLETIEADSGSALDSRYNFIREYARYDIGDYPVFYFLRRTGIILLVNEFVDAPEVHLTSHRMKYLHSDDAFVEFEMLGHVIAIPIRQRADLVFRQYLEASTELKKQLFCGFVRVDRFTDLDVTLNMYREDNDYRNWLAAHYGHRLVRF